jgi:FlaA1/EpsC-like NDP-sugar epimerase
MKYIPHDKHFYGLFLADMVLAALSLYLAYVLRFEFAIPRSYLQNIPHILGGALIIKMTTFVLFGVYRGPWPHTSLADILTIIRAVVVSTLILISVILVMTRFESYAYSVFIIDWALTLLSIAGLRLSLRLYFTQSGRKSLFSVFSRSDDRASHFFIIETGIFLVDSAFVLLSLYLAYAIRFEFQVPQDELAAMLRILPFVFILKMGTFVLFHIYRCVWQYTSLTDLLNVIKGGTLSTLLIISVLLVINRVQGYPRSVFILDWALTLIFVGGVRVAIRLYYAMHTGTQLFPTLARLRFGSKKLLIMGTGSLLVDAVTIVGCFYLAYAIRFEFQIPPTEFQEMAQVLPLIFLIKMAMFLFFRMYQGIWRFISLVELVNVVKAVTVSTMGIVLTLVVLNRFEGYPRSVFMIDWGLTLIVVGGVRVGIRLYFSRRPGREMLQIVSPKRLMGKRLLIIGAGSAGEKVLRELLDNPRLKLFPVGILDDDPQKQGRTIHGVEVLGTVEQIETFRSLFDEVLIALPSASASQMRAIVAACEKIEKRFRTVPAIGELIDGKVSIKTIRDVTLQDLLGRKEVRLSKDDIAAYLQGKRILITGAGGSIGSELVRQVSRFRPEAVGLVDMSEFNLFRIEMECRQRFAFVKTSSFLVDIRDVEGIQRTFKHFRPQVVFHTAAYKHVPLQELHPWEAVRNNIIGTRNLVQAAQARAVEHFVLVSTDKAVRPTNVMGVTKRVAEKVVLCANAESPESRFMVVRFGNVLGSSGSVIPTFQAQIERGGPITVTHPDVTRYFMSIPEAAQLTLQAGAMGKGGETFLLDMGQPVRIADLARDLIQLHGYEPDRDILIQYVGLRPGEKLYEELMTVGEGIVETEHEKIMVLQGDGHNPEHLAHHIEVLLTLVQTYDAAKIKRYLKTVIPEYTPQFRRANELQTESEKR